MQQKELEEEKIQVRVTPNAAANKIRMEQQPNGNRLMRVHITIKPEKGAANKAVIKLLSKYFKLPQHALSITHGMHTKDKVIVIKRY